MVRLGPKDVIRVAAYRLALRASIHPVQRLAVAVPHAPFFLPSEAKASVTPASVDEWRDGGKLFGIHEISVPNGVCPDWHFDYLSSRKSSATHLPWWQIPDFGGHDAADIKSIWELSRFGWAIPMSQRAALGEREAWTQLNFWLEDWCAKNPPYQGPNWKCGQEASIRVLNLASAALISGLTETTPGMASLLEAHLLRIEPTLGYAVGQNNNHGTSEAAALFVGGEWLNRVGHPRSDRWSKLGRYWLENRVRSLVTPDGTFSQYSVNYQRLVIDTLSIAEVWRQFVGAEAFSLGYLTRAAAAVEWLASMVDETTGDAPNIGANDGAQLLRTASAGFRDYRPSVQLATVLFKDVCAYPGSGSWDEPLAYYGLNKPTAKSTTQASALFDEGGFAVLRSGDACAVLRYPRFKFRPAQADLLHCDLTARGQNVLRDAGTYSYAVAPKNSEEFQGVAGHNTIQFDDRPQLRRLSRFMYADWPTVTDESTLTTTVEGTSFCAGFRDWTGASHTRTITLRENELVVRDEIGGFARKAVLRWRLLPLEWQVTDTTIKANEFSITVDADVPIQVFNLASGWESRYYLHKSRIPVLEVEVDRPAVLVTRCTWRK